MLAGNPLFASQAGDTATQATQGEPGAKKPRVEENSTCLPVTIRQMELALAQRNNKDEDLKFFGCEPKELIVVASVEAVLPQQSSLEMTLNDGTGRLKARHFVTDAGDNSIEKIVPGSYISCFGMLRSAPTVHFAATGVRLLTNADEVSYHMIEVAHTALKLQKGTAPLMPTAAKEGLVETPKKLPAVEETPTPSGAFTSPPKAEEAAEADLAAAAAPAASAPVSGAPSGESLKKTVLDIIDKHDRDQGAAVAHLASTAGASEAAVREVIATLVDDAEVFQTVDGDHFAILE